MFRQLATSCSHASWREPTALRQYSLESAVLLDRNAQLNLILSTDPGDNSS